MSRIGKQLILPLNDKILKPLEQKNNVDSTTQKIDIVQPVSAEQTTHKIKISLNQQIGLKSEAELKEPDTLKISIANMPNIANKTGVPSIRPSISNANFDRSVSETHKNKLLEMSKKAENSLESLKIVSSMIRFISFEELKNIAVVKIDKIKDGNDNKARLGTLDDPSMGPSESTEICATCYKNSFHCLGHPGMIVLHKPILHPECIQYIVKILKCICNDCSELLISREELEERGILRKTGKSRLDAIVEISQKMHCRRTVEEGVAKCVRNPKFISSKIKDSNKIWYERVESGNTITRFMDVNEIMQKFKALSDSDVQTLGFTNGAHPINMILRGIYVMSPINRSTTFRDGQTYPHNFTIMYTDIIKENNKIGAELQKPINTRNEAIISESLEKLAFFIKHFINNSDGKYSNPHKQPQEGIKQKIQGKEGVIRGLIMGKRVNFAGRSVMSPDPNLKFGQIRIPKVWASILTRPETVFSANLERIKNLFEAGHISYITKKGGLGQIKITPDNKKAISIEIGDVIERWLQNGDYLLYNRQPSIQKECMMGYEVVLGDEITIGAHVSICRAHNLDFDGDEGNMHAMQILDAVIESYRIASARQCIINSQSNRNMVDIPMDSITAAYLLSRDRDGVIDPDTWYNCLVMLTECSQLEDLEVRLQKHSVKSFTGPALISALFPSDFQYKKGNVVISDGILTSGIITKDHFGTTSNSLIEAIYKRYGTERATVFLTDAPYMMNEYMYTNPFSIRYSDCLIEDPEHMKNIESNISNAKIAVSEIEKRRAMRRNMEKLKHMKENKLMYEQEEKEIINKLNTTRNIGVKISKELLGPNNGLNISALSKVKGDNFNIAQITALVGQQFINGKRPVKNMSGNTRCSPYFPPNSDTIESGGFCTGNFFTGLPPAEMYFLQVGGRENTVESSIKVSSSGYLSRKIFTNTQDITVHQSMLIRTTRGYIFQFSYADGFASNELNFVETKSGPKLSFINLKSVVNQLNSSYGFASNLN